MYSSKKRVSTRPDRYHLKRKVIDITISERIGTRVVIEYRLSAQKMEIIARTVYRVIAMHRSQYGSSFAVFRFVTKKSMLIFLENYYIQKYVINNIN